MTFVDRFVLYFLFGCEISKMVSAYLSDKQRLKNAKELKAQIDALRKEFDVKDQAMETPH